MNSAESQNKKHAYLFLVCKNTYVFQKCLQLIDDERNDIYIHVDKSCRNWAYEFYDSLVKKSKIYYTQRTNCNWAAFSLFNAELILMKAAADKKNEYAYYHLMSEACLPLVSQDVIHNELADCKYDYTEIKGVTFDTDKWTRYYYFFTETPLYRKSKIIKGISRIILILPQKLLNVNRWRNEKNIYGESIKSLWGWQWFSLRDETVRLILKKTDFIKKHFIRTHCPDETCIPTVLYNFTDMSSVADSKRSINMISGKPLVITMANHEKLINSDDFFARKFDENTDKEIIDRIFSKVMGEHE